MDVTVSKSAGSTSCYSVPATATHRLASRLSPSLSSSSLSSEDSAGIVNGFVLTAAAAAAPAFEEGTLAGAVGRDGRG